MNTAKVITAIAHELNECSALLESNRDSDLYAVATAALKVASLPEYQITDYTVMGNPEDISDGADFGRLSLTIMEATDRNEPLYYIPTSDGTVKRSSADYVYSAITEQVKAGKAYKYIPGSHTFIEV